MSVCDVVLSLSFTTYNALTLVPFGLYLIKAGVDLPSSSSSADSAGEDDLLDVAEADVGQLLSMAEDHAVRVHVVVGNTHQVLGAVWTQEHHLVQPPLEHVVLIVDVDVPEDVILIDLEAVLLVLDIGLDALGGVRMLNIEGNGLTGEDLAVPHDL